MSLAFSLQALLLRHEALTAEAEAAKERYEQELASVSCRWQEQKTQNDALVRDNKQLRQQIDSLSTPSITKSSIEYGLEQGCKDSQPVKDAAADAEMQRLKGQVIRLEADAHRLQEDLDASQRAVAATSAKSVTAEEKAVEATTRITSLEDKLLEQRQQHKDSMMRLQRIHLAEQELESGGHRKSTRSGQSANSGSVISSFVKDILQDNANLQLSMLELQETLMNANEEVAELRAQVSSFQSSRKSDTGHVQPQTNSVDVKRASIISGMTTSTIDTPKDVHVHHHYHPIVGPASRPARSRQAIAVRPRIPRQTYAQPATQPIKKMYAGKESTIHNSREPRPSLVSSSDSFDDEACTLPSFSTQKSSTLDSRHPSRPQTLHIDTSSPAGQSCVDRVSKESDMPLSRRTVSCHMRASSTTKSSLPSSPLSGFQDYSLFDSVENGPDSSSPTTPASTQYGSPDCYQQHKKHESETSISNLTFRNRTRTPISPYTVGTFAISQNSMHDSPRHCSRALPMSRDNHDSDSLSTASTNQTQVTAADTRQNDNDHLNTSRLHVTSRHQVTDPATQSTYDESDIERDSSAEEEEEEEEEEPDEDVTIQPQIPSRLHRAKSAESILSTHSHALAVNRAALRPKRSQILPSARATLGSTSTFVEPVTSSTSALGRSSHSSRQYDSSNYNRLLLGTVASPMPKSHLALPATSISAPRVPQGPARPDARETLGQKLGGWMTSKWSAPAGSLSSKTSDQPILMKLAPWTGRAGENGTSVSHKIQGRETASEALSLSQSDGSSDGKRLSVHVEAVTVNDELLREALGGPMVTH